ncbi:Leukotoxin secretion protein [Vibrio scophthalmi]|uniref:Leukotoxin secretion protein n=1 Tax=Vibrio scophthalmi TaxID=45658 RepID=A0A1C7FIB1_9VIBR|nr:Leukotoxin secretion protein [Vibrio scophthalmi]
MTKRSYNRLNADELDYVDDKTAALLLNTPNSARIMLWLMLLFFIIAVAWASWAEIDKVTVGQGKVVPSSQIQVIQNLEGGLVKEILVREGQMVEKGQQLLLIDDTRFRSDFREREQQVANLTASVIQLSPLSPVSQLPKSLIVPTGKKTSPLITVNSNSLKVLKNDALS